MYSYFFGLSLFSREFYVLIIVIIVVAIITVHIKTRRCPAGARGCVDGY